MKAGGGKGQDPARGSLWSRGGKHDREEDMHKRCCVEEREAERKKQQKKEGCKMKDFATIKTPHGQKNDLHRTK